MDRVASVAKLAHLVIADLSVCRQRYSVMFSETLNMDYVSAAWREFELSLGPLARDAVESVCDRLTTDKVPAEENLENERGTKTADLSTGTRLFECYLALQQGCPVSVDVSCIIVRHGICYSGFA